MRIPLIFGAAMILAFARPVQSQNYRGGGLIFSAQIDEVDWENVNRSFHSVYEDRPGQWLVDSVPLVRSVQYLLRARGIAIKIDGDFGPLTEAAVTWFQRAHGLKADGIVGAKTWAKLVVPLERGARGDAVRAVQIMLEDCYKINSQLRPIPDGLFVPTGIFGPKTQADVLQLQRRGGAHRVDGKVNFALWRYLVSASINEPGN